MLACTLSYYLLSSQLLSGTSPVLPLVDHCFSGLLDDLKLKKTIFLKVKNQIEQNKYLYRLLYAGDKLCCVCQPRTVTSRCTRSQCKPCATSTRSLSSEQTTTRSSASGPVSARSTTPARRGKSLAAPALLSRSVE